MLSGGEDGGAAFVLYRQQLLLRIDVCLQDAIIYCRGTTLIEPVGQTGIIDFFLVILYADSVTSHRGYFQESVTKVQGFRFLLCFAENTDAKRQDNKTDFLHFV